MDRFTRHHCTMMTVLAGGERILSVYMQLPNTFFSITICRSGVFNDVNCVSNNAHAMNIVWLWNFELHRLLGK
uniref:Uncharacterized protein n=1 Tax=Daphnia galeata TaxID=27404 RepID=A0A8J2SCS7_9CRUS|nr:unnamed protein product [Daphnia galeata]